MMIPMFGNLSEKLHHISGFLFTGVLTEMASGFAEGMSYTLKPLDIAVLIGELIISILVFLVLYRRNGYETDWCNLDRVILWNATLRRLFFFAVEGRLHFYPAKWCGYWSSPSLTVITRLLLFAASGEWVTMIIVCPRSLLIRCNKLIISAPVWLSGFPVGSSANRISGFAISARAIIPFQIIRSL